MPLPTIKSILKRAGLVKRVLCADDPWLDEWHSKLDAEIASFQSPASQPLSDLHLENAGSEEPVVDQNGSDDECAAVDSEAVAELGRRLADRINHNLQDARIKTEQAVVSVCEQVARLVEIAQAGSAEAQGTLCAVIGGPACVQQVMHEASITNVIQTQAESVNAFIHDHRTFFQQQMDSVNDATAACREMQLCVAQVVKLVFSSEILAYNIQIESARLGDQGRAFSVLGDEMVRFSSKVRDANIAIQKSLNQVNASLQRFHEESKNMDARLDAFTTLLHRRMADVEAKNERID